MKNFSWVIPQKLAGSDIPGRHNTSENGIREDLQKLVSEGVQNLVSLQKPFGEMEKHCEELGLKWIYFPIADYGIPENMEKFDELISKIIKQIESQKPVCIHCYAGIGRTGMVLSCVMGRYFVLSAKKAIAAVRKIRNSIDTVEQEMFISTFLERYEY